MENLECLEPVAACDFDSTFPNSALTISSTCTNTPLNISATDEEKCDTIQTYLCNLPSTSPISEYGVAALHQSWTTATSLGPNESVEAGTAILHGSLSSTARQPANDTDDNLTSPSSQSFSMQYYSQLPAPTPNSESVLFTKASSHEDNQLISRRRPGPSNYNLPSLPSRARQVGK